MYIHVRRYCFLKRDAPKPTGMCHEFCRIGNLLVTGGRGDGIEIMKAMELRTDLKCMMDL